MAQSILVFDFGTNEEAAQQARHKIEGWRHGFRLGNKMLLKFERAADGSPENAAGDSGKKAAAAEEPAGKKKSSAKTAKEPEKTSAEGSSGGAIRLLVRLDFSEHEKLSHQRWLGRIPAEEPFKSTKSETFRSGDPAFAKTSELFDSLD